ncbi:MAG: D-alanyl-D-alanine carboxypeptidase [Actinobacteria bacterium]|nr:D-alanyl-D-alanine carboxypeptidase [Actinomycetota bacterium]
MKLRPLSLVSISVVLVALTAAMTSGAPAALKSSTISPILKSAASSKTLANPGLILVDPVTGETIFQNDADSLRMPASLLKIFSAAALLDYLTPDYRFTTEILTGAEPNTLMIAGSLDPWMERNNTLATKMGRVSLPKIVKTALKKLDADNGAPIKTLRIEYSKMHSVDLDFIKAQFVARNVKVTTAKVTSAEAYLYSKESIAKFQSPPLQQIMDWMLLWSDNTLGNRMAMYASMKAGFGYAETGIEETFVKTLNNLEIDSTGLNAVDGSGLSRANRVSTKMLAQLLLKTYDNDKYRTIYGGLPVGGVNGTMRNRFVASAPKAIGLVRTKTGSLTGVVSMAGYVQGGDHEYIFVAIADQIPKNRTAAKAVRVALDKVLAKFAKPVPGISPSPSSVVQSPDATPSTNN